MTEISKVIKRDGKLEKFSTRKLVNAVTKAYKACNSAPSKEVISQLKSEFSTIEKETIGVDEIHEVVEKFLNSR